MDYYYNFCGVPFRIAAPEVLWEDSDSPKFRCAPCAPAITIEITSAPQLPAMTGRFLGHRGEKYIWRDGSTVTRLTQDVFRSQPHMLCTYDLNSPGSVRCIAREEDWRWATRSQFLWPGVSLPQLLLHHDTLTFHASYVAHQDWGILFTAPSQTGKSTQASLWEKHRGARVLNGDKAAVRLGERPMVHGMPFSGTSGICENVSMPLGCIVVLSQAKENTVRRLGAQEALSLLSPNVFSDQLISEEWQKTLLLLLDFMAAVPIYALACTPDVRAVEELEAAMARDGLQFSH